ncbi:MAG: WG repeat-containing protein, partial [Neisseriaceae bacterium]|nr:WG repeat-containing protein [Neisseriaceae bacterium]
MKKTALFLSLAMLFATTACNQSQDTSNTPTTLAPQQTTTEPESVVDKMKNYDEVSSFYSGLAAVKKDGKWGFIDKTGKEIVALQYDDACDFNQELAAVQKDGKWGFVDKTGKERTAMIYETIWPLHQGYFAVQQDITNWNGGVYRWGIVDNFALEVAPAIQRNNDFISFSPDEGLFQFATTENRVGFTDKQGHEVVPFQYDNIATESGEGSICKEGLCVVAKNNLWGFVDSTGRLAIMLQYEYASDFNEGMAAVKQNDKWGFVDKTGKATIALQYDTAQNFSDGLAAVQKGEQWFLIDKTGKEIAALPNYEWVEPFHNGLAKVVKNELVGFIDKNGKEVIACQYENIYDKDGTPFVGNGLLTVSQNGKWGLIDATGKEIVPPQYDEALNFEDDLALVSKNFTHYGFVDKNGKEVIDLQYDFAYPFSDGLAFVKKEGIGQ